ncbi:MAG: hypothetical protein ACP5QG_01285 [candidate division WOR-3 bacterium]
MRRLIPLLCLSCSLNSYHSPRALHESDATVGASWTAFPITEEREPDSSIKDTQGVIRILGFPTVWIRYGLAHRTEAGMGIALFRYKPIDTDEYVISITACPYIKREFFTAGPFLASGFLEAGAGTGKFFIAGSDSSYDTSSSAYYGSAGIVPGFIFSNWEIALPIKYTFGYIPSLATAGYVSVGPGAALSWSSHRVFLEATLHYAGSDLATFSGGGGFDF